MFTEEYFKRTMSDLERDVAEALSGTAGVFVCSVNRHDNDIVNRKEVCYEKRNRRRGADPLDEHGGVLVGSDPSK